MRQATRDYHLYKENKEKYITTPAQDHLSDTESNSDEVTRKEPKSNETENIQEDSNKKKLEPTNSLNEETNLTDLQEDDKSEELDPLQEEDQGFFNCYFFTRLFV